VPIEAGSKPRETSLVAEAQPAQEVVSMSTADPEDLAGPTRRPFQTPCVEISEISAGTTVMTLHGEYDIFTKYRLVEALERVADVPNVIIDLTPCTFLDSSVITVLFSRCYADRADHHRAMLVLPDTDGIVNRTIRLTRVGELLPVYESVGCALEAAGGGR
jgi:anti-anti-sigma factor